MNRTVFALGIIFLLVGASVVSSMNTVETIQSNENNTNDNDFFNKLIMPDSFHDVAIKNITSPSNPRNGFVKSKTFSPPLPELYIQPGTENIDVIVENNGTFPEFNLTCTAQIWDYEEHNGSLVYEDIITDIDLEEPLGGTELLNFDDFTFAWEGVYRLYLDLPLEIDDFPENNHEELIIGVDDGEPYSWIEEMDPPEPDGENGWYVSDIKITICAEDPEIAPGIPGSGIHGEDCITIIIDKDGDDVPVEYWAVDNVGNEETHHHFTVDMDQTPPTIDLTYEIVSGNPIQGWVLEFTATGSDVTSGIDHIEFYLNDVLQDTGPGPTYSWSFKYHGGMNIEIKIIVYDKAGNNATKIIENPKPTSYNYNNQNSLLKSQFHLMTNIKNNKSSQRGYE